MLMLTTLSQYMSLNPNFEPFNCIGNVILFPQLNPIIELVT